VLALLLTLGSALASPAELYGFGAAAMGRSGGGVALDGDAGSALLNPAALAGHDRSQLLLGYTVVRFDFEDAPPVYWDTNRDGSIDEHDEPLDLGGYDHGDGLMLGLRRPIGERFGFGAAMFIPQQRLLRLQTTDPQLPNYFMYRNRTQRYALALGFGGQPVRSLYIGGGFRVLSRSVIDVTMTIDAVVDGSGTEGGVEDVVALEARVHDMSFDLKPAVVPVLGLRWEVGEVVRPLEGLALGFTWRNEGGIPVDVNLDAQLNARAEDLGELDPVSMAALAEVYVSIYDHYMPMQFIGGGSWSFEDTFHVYLDAHYTRWSAMRLNSTELISSSLDATMADLSELEFENGHDVGEIQWRDTWSVRTGTELNLPVVELPGRLGWIRPGFRGGFGYEPTPLVAQSGHTALLDADRMIFGVGASLAHGAIWDICEGPVRWDLFFQYHSLAQGTLARPETAEPRPGYAVDGQPVPIGGRFLATGLQWSFDY
jgi:long-subunit fatty acid transport protein